MVRAAATHTPPEDARAGSGDDAHREFLGALCSWDRRRALVGSQEAKRLTGGLDERGGRGLSYSDIAQPKVLHCSRVLWCLDDGVFWAHHAE